jgi:hypothetical protein
MKTKQVLLLLALAAPMTVMAQNPIPPGTNYNPADWLANLTALFAAMAPSGTVMSLQLDSDGTTVAAGTSNPNASLTVESVQVDTGDGRGVQEWDKPIMINGKQGL